MSNRRGGGNRIRGPHSALTDFLAANNISAQEIRDSYLQRQQLAAQQEAENDNGEGSAEQQDEEQAAVEAESSRMAAERTRKRKKNTEDAIAKIKKGKEAKKGKAAAAKKRKRDDDGDDPDDSDFSDINDMYKKAKPLPGQLENCDICGKRFTVTPYSKAGPEGGLLCTPCGKTLAKETKASEKAAKPPAVRGRGRRKIESNRLDGFTQQGAKTLQQLCIEKLAHHSTDIEEFGELPDMLMNELSEIFSKKRVMNSHTIPLFLRPENDVVAIHEAAYLESEDYDKIFAMSPNVEKVVLRNSCQFKDPNMDYMTEKGTKLKHIFLTGANLVSNDKWIDLFIARGEQLESLKLEWLDAAFNDQAVQALIEFCPNLKRLKLERCRLIGADAIDAIARAKNLEHLTLQMSKEIPHEQVVNMIHSVGANLRTLCLERFLDTEDEPTDDILMAIHGTCRNLTKFRFTHNNECSDAGYVALFQGWENPPLRYADLNSTRDVDNTNPEGPLDFPIGLASEGFKALMEHSGDRLEYLDISSCRHISYETFAEVFHPDKHYRRLEEINLSFCAVVDTHIVASIFRCCPQIKKVVTFGCFEVADVVVPRGIVLIGAPRAQDAIEQFGDAVLDFERGFGGMIGVGA